MNCFHIKVAAREAGEVNDDAKVVNDFLVALLAALLEHVNNVAHEFVNVLFLRIVVAHFDESNWSAFEVFFLQNDALVGFDLLAHKIIGLWADVVDVEFLSPFGVLSSIPRNQTDKFLPDGKRSLKNAKLRSRWLRRPFPVSRSCSGTSSKRNGCNAFSARCKL